MIAKTSFSYQFLYCDIHDEVLHYYPRRYLYCSATQVSKRLFFFFDGQYTFKTGIHNILNIMIFFESMYIFTSIFSTICSISFVAPSCVQFTLNEYFYCYILCKHKFIIYYIYLRKALRMYGIYNVLFSFFTSTYVYLARFLLCLQDFVYFAL